MFLVLDTLSFFLSFSLSFSLPLPPPLLSPSKMAQIIEESQVLVPVNEKVSLSLSPSPNKKGR
jgi:hypothetical protein